MRPASEGGEKRCFDADRHNGNDERFADLSLSLSLSLQATLLSQDDGVGGGMGKPILLLKGKKLRRDFAITISNTNFSLRGYVDPAFCLPLVAGASFTQPLETRNMHIGVLGQADAAPLRSLAGRGALKGAGRKKKEETRTRTKK